MYGRPPARLSRTSAIAIALVGAALACGTSKPTSERRPIDSLLAERARTDTRTDSFTLAADRGRVLGAATARVWVVIVSDFQCADCKKWHDDVFPLIRKEYVATGRVRVGYVNMPLRAHLNAMPTALAAACASAQGKFWETHDRIFETQSQWKDLPDARPFLDSLAIAAGADAASERLCTERARATKFVRMDGERSGKAGVDSLPTFFIGTHTLRGPASVATFRAVIDSALAGK
jgi:protein-disulfide isomerase